jgi:hypothetical protein
VGEFEQPTELFQRCFSHTSTGLALNWFLISQKLPVFKAKIGKWEIDAKPSRLRLSVIFYVTFRVIFLT